MRLVRLSISVLTPEPLPVYGDYLCVCNQWAFADDWADAVNRLLINNVQNRSPGLMGATINDLGGMEEIGENICRPFSEKKVTSSNISDNHINNGYMHHCFLVPWAYLCNTTLNMATTNVQEL